MGQLEAVKLLLDAGAEPETLQERRMVALR